MNGKTVIVTGANSGIGIETAAELAAMGARTVLTARDPAKGRAAVDMIRQRTPDADITMMELDLSHLSSVRGFAQRFLDEHGDLHVLVNNAGLVQEQRSVTPDGFETTFGVNHLGPFLLTNLLLDRMRSSAPARIVNVSSSAHRRMTLDFDDLHSEREYASMQVYGRSKLANILFTKELARRLAGTGVTANALHPGVVRTNWGQGQSPIFRLGWRIGGVFFLSPAKGAKTSVYLASSPEVEGISGGYWVRCRRVEPSPVAQDDEVAARLWDVSAELVGL